MQDKVSWKQQSPLRLGQEYALKHDQPLKQMLTMLMHRNGLYQDNAMMCFAGMKE